MVGLSYKARTVAKTFLFSLRKEQEVSLLSDAENLSALLQEAARQCEKPNTLPEAGEHMIEEFKISESGLLDEQVIVSHLIEKWFYRIMISTNGQAVAKLRMFLYLFSQKTLNHVYLRIDFKRHVF